jgi:lysozyme family protein
MSVDRLIDEVIRKEGGYVNHPADKGGPTKFGITQAVAIGHGYTGHMRDLPIALARRIYRRQYLEKPGFDKLPAPFDMLAFDAGVNSGPSRGAKWVQQGLGVKADGKIGPVTIAAAKRAAEEGDGAAVLRCVEVRSRFLAKLCKSNPSQIAFVEGWWVRTLTVLAHALTEESE